MPYSVSCDDLRRMTPAARAAALSELVSRSTRRGGVAVVRGNVRAFEERYRMTSEDLLAALREGRQEETADISRWLFWLQVLIDRGH